VIRADWLDRVFSTVEFSTEDDGEPTFAVVAEINKQLDLDKGDTQVVANDKNVAGRSGDRYFC
jgi:hypothetical protein